MHDASRLLARLWPFVVTTAACGPAVPSTSSSGTTGAHTAPSSTVGIAPANTKETSPSLPTCGACSPHCYADTSGAECLPYTAAAALDARLGCHFDGAFGRHREGDQCCYGGTCPGRPLVVARAPRIASLRLGLPWES